MIYVLDHKDSFTHNVVHQFSLYDEVRCTNYDEINNRYLKTASTLVLSPGPGSPKDYPITTNIYKNFKRKKRIVGICLGFQQILFCEGAKIVQQKKIYHGFQSKVKVVSKNSIFKNKNIYKVGRYHSLKLEEPFYSKNFDITMRCAISGSAMALENNFDKVYGFQFHPESFLTINGNLLIKKILST